MEDFMDLVKIVFFATGVLLVVFVIVAIPVLSIGYVSSCKQATIYNTQNGTEWTCGDFFWAGEQINSSTNTIKLQ